MAKMLYRNDRFVTVHNKCSKIQLTVKDLRTRHAMCIDSGGGIF